MFREMILRKLLRAFSVDTHYTRNLSSVNSCSNIYRNVSQCWKCINLMKPLASAGILKFQRLRCRTEQPICQINTTSYTEQALVRRTAEMIIHSEPTFLLRLKERFNFFYKLRFNRFRMRVAGLNMYSSCVDGVDFLKFFRACRMSDTLFSWFLVTQLHVWMCMLRLRHEGREGKYMTHYLILSMWTDVTERARVMDIPSSKIREATSKMVEQFHGVLLAYDEGILSDDRVLAGALWRNLFLQRCDDPDVLADMVEYVRMQVQYLETLDSSQLLQKGRIKWLPYKGNISHLPEDLKKAISVDEELLGPDPNATDKIPT